jgi:hypothetical protein
LLAGEAIDGLFVVKGCLWLCFDFHSAKLAGKLVDMHGLFEESRQWMAGLLEMEPCML